MNFPMVIQIWYFMVLRLCRLKDLLCNIAEGRERLDMDRMANLVHRRVLDTLSGVSHAL